MEIYTKRLVFCKEKWGVNFNTAGNENQPVLKNKKVEH
jgi:hypothetical protein